jgi:regulator of sirC expression with transglutaminase-like and TPR domain
MEMAEARKALKELINAPGQDFDLAQAALLIACEMNPEIRPRAYLDRLDAWAAELQARGQGLDIAGRLDALATYLGQEQGLTGNREDYYEPSNSFLDQVLDRKLGIPISLSVAYLSVAGRLGLPLAGIPLPGHFLVAPVGGAHFYDPFEGGRRLERADLQAILDRLFGAGTRLEDAMLRPMPKRQILARLVRNLKHIYSARGDLKLLLWATDLGLALEPKEVDLLKERGLVYYQMSHYSKALEDLQAYLKRVPRGEGSDEESPGLQHVELIYRLLTSIN